MVIFEHLHVWPGHFTYHTSTILYRTAGYDIDYLFIYFVNIRFGVNLLLLELRWFRNLFQVQECGNPEVSQVR